MKVRPFCLDCLKGLARQAVILSDGSDALFNSCVELVEGLFQDHVSPTAISNALLKGVREETGVQDPYAEKKAIEFRDAMKAAAECSHYFPATLQGALMASAFGNGSDYFLDHTYDLRQYLFSGDLAKIEEGVYITTKVLILGDNVGDFVFDLPLVDFLKGVGKEVLYAVKERPIQNDLSMADVTRLRLNRMCSEVISTGTDEVGMRKETMSGAVKECWEDGSLIIAKGMGNFETLSEFDQGRPVTYIMKVKCRSVAESLSRNVGEHIALYRR
jgi:damage-control phosphatase, subfamily I